MHCCSDTAYRVIRVRMLCVFLSVNNITLSFRDGKLIVFILDINFLNV